MAHPGGRPTKYLSEMCDIARALMRDGASLCEVAYELKINVSTLADWREKNEEFSLAIKESLDDAQGWWMTKGRKNIENKSFNSTLWYMNMKNRFGWKDTQEVVQTSTTHMTISEHTQDIKDAAKAYEKAE